MKKIFIGMCLIAVIILVSGCGKKSQDGADVPVETKSEVGGKWKIEKNISEKIVAIGGESDVIIGDVEKEKVSVSIPKGAFSKKTEISVANPETVPDYVAKDMEPLGSPIELMADGGHTRLDEKALISFKFDPSILPQNPDDFSELRIVYHSGAEWEYIKPIAIVKETGVVTFETYHFSLMGLTKIKDETKLTENWIHSAAVDKVMRDNINKTSDHVANQIVDMMLAKMGISDESTKGKVLGELLKSDSYRDIYNEYEKGDVVSMNQKIAILAGDKIASNVPESIFSKALGNVTGSAEDIAAVSKAAGFVAGGQYKDAAKIIGEQIADKFLITTAGKIAFEVMDYQIQSWKSSEVEAAFKAYKNGADGVFWGYNVDKGDFDAVWDQMRGIRRQIEIDALRKENSQRKEAGMPELSERQADMLRNSLRESYRKQFEERQKQEDKIAKIEADLKTLFDAFKKKDVFSSSLGPDGLNGKGYDFEQKLEILNKFAQKMMRDTGRFELSDKEVTLKEGAITADSIALGARIYFSVPDGKKKYAEYLATSFGISLYPELKDLSGDWQNGKMVITDVIVPEALKNKPKDEKSNELGCDFSMDLSQLKGKEVPMSFSLSPSGDGAGTLTLKGEGSDGKAMPFTYSDGLLKASFGEKGAVANIDLEISRGQKDFLASGSMIITYSAPEGEAKIIATLTATKPMPDPKNKK